MYYQLETLTTQGWSSVFALLEYEMNQAANRYEKQEQALKMVGDLHELWPDATLRVTRVWEEGE